MKRTKREPKYKRVYRDNGTVQYAVHCTPKAAKDPKFWRAMDKLMEAAVRLAEG